MTERTTPTGRKLRLVKGGGGPPEHWTVAAAKLGAEVLSEAGDEMTRGRYDFVVFAIGNLDVGDVIMHSTIADPADLLLVQAEFGDLIDRMRRGDDE